MKNEKNMKNSIQDKKLAMAASEGLLGKILAGIAIIALVAVLAGVAWESLKPTYLLSYDGEKLQQKDLIYDIYQVENVGAQMASIYEQFGSTDDYWNMDNGDGTTTQDSLAEEAFEGYVYNRVLYAKALEEGYEATEEERAASEEAADNTIAALTEKKAKKLGLTKEVLTERDLQETVVERFKQDKIASFEIDKEAIREGVDYEEHHGYKIEYFYVTTKDADGNKIEDTDSLKKALTDTISKAGQSDDWSTVIGEDETSDVKYATKVLTPDSETFSEDVLKMVFAMENGENTGVLEDDNSMYAIRMIDNDDHSEYESAVESEISDAEESAFADYYQALREEHEAIMYDKNWKKVVFGSVTLG